jgi:uncharacterized membrane protein
MYEWFSQTRNRLIYFFVYSLIPMILYVTLFVHLFVVELSTSFFIAVGMRFFEIFSIWVPIAIGISGVFIGLSIYRAFRREPIKYYAWVGSISFILANLFWIGLALLSS